MKKKKKKRKKKKKKKTTNEKERFVLTGPHLETTHLFLNI